MKHLLIILISFLLLSSPVIGEETGVLYLWENGTKYMGEWKDGKKHGQGTETWSSGWKYVGEWREGKPWNVTIYGKSGIIILKYVNGVEQK